MQPSTALSTAALALAVLGSTPIGEAAKGLVLPPGSVGTAQLKRDAVTGVKVKNGSLLAADFARGQLPAGPAGAPGPAGAAGPAGAKGDRGEPATRLWATVNDNGTISRQSGGVTAMRAATGQYFVTFDRDVAGCAWLASGRVGFPRVREHPAPSTVIVEIKDGGATDSLFHLAMVC